MSKNYSSKNHSPKVSSSRQGQAKRSSAKENNIQFSDEKPKKITREKTYDKTNRNTHTQKQENTPVQKTRISRINPHHFLYGTHAVNAALNNPNRVLKILYVASHRQADYERFSDRVKVQTVSSDDLENLLPENAVHQGVALYAVLKDIKETQDFSKGNKPIVILDGITDPQNIGSILRTSAAFGVEHLIIQDKGSPDITGAMAKAAAGAIETVRIHRVVNLSRAIDVLKSNKYMVYAADAESELSLNVINFPQKTAIVMGAEGNGLRRLVKENCDFTFSIPISKTMESLNVSNAFSIIIYKVVS